MNEDDVQITITIPKDKIRIIEKALNVGDAIADCEDRRIEGYPLKTSALITICGLFLSTAEHFYVLDDGMAEEIEDVLKSEEPVKAAVIEQGVLDAAVGKPGFMVAKVDLMTHAIKIALDIESEDFEPAREATFSLHTRLLALDVLVEEESKKNEEERKGRQK